MRERQKTHKAVNAVILSTYNLRPKDSVNKRAFQKETAGVDGKIGGGGGFLDIEKKRKSRRGGGGDIIKACEPSFLFKHKEKGQGKEWANRENDALCY